MSREISLLINTRDRADGLERTLASIDTSEAADVDGEVIIVDNGSSDDTAKVIKHFAEEAACPVKYVFEPVPGASRAKNAGVRVAEGRVLAFIDDDCHPSPGHFRNVLAAFGLRRFAYCGGRILLDDPDDARYGINEDDSFRLIPPFSFVPAGAVEGACMAWEAETVWALGLFDERFGPGTPFRCDELELCARASLAGHWGAHVPSMVVSHAHGRKVGTPELRAVKRGNDYARGAYYAKFILRGNLDYLAGWVRTSYEHRRQFSIRTEVKGAAHFTFDCLQATLSRRSAAS